MIRILIKIILTVITLYVGTIIFALMKFSLMIATKQSDSLLIDMLPLLVGVGMFVGIRAIWKYQPKSNEITLKKDD